MANSTYPATSMLDFSHFSTKAEFTSKNLPQSTVDRLFIAANVELED